MRMLTLVVALVAVLLAGCSKLPLSPTDRVRGAVVAAGLAGAAQASVSSRTAVLGQSVDITGSGPVDLAHQTADLTLQVPLLGGSVRTIIAGGQVYAQLPSTFSLFTAFLPGAKPWVSISIDRLSQQQFGTSLAQLGIGPSGDTLTQLGYLKGLQDAREVGQEPVGGAPTTHYAATIDLSHTPAASDPATRPAVDRLIAQIGSPTLPVDVWVDDDGRLRQIVQTVRAAPQAGIPPTDQTTTLTFTAFGVPAPAGPPPPQDVTDLSTLLPTG